MTWLTTSLESPWDIKPLNPKLDGDAQVVDKCLVFRHIVGCTKVQLNHVEELISLWRDQHHTSPSSVEGIRAIEIHVPVLLGDWRGGGERAAAESRSIWPQNPPKPGT
jgi:hypothetical protein